MKERRGRPASDEACVCNVQLVVCSPPAECLAMSCLDVMYQVYGSPPQPYFATAYSPYHHQVGPDLFPGLRDARVRVHMGPVFVCAPKLTLQDLGERFSLGI